MNIIQIVPRLSPDVCGVGDYARLLGGAMQQTGVTTRFVVTNPEWKGEKALDGNPVELLAARNPQALHRLLERLDCPRVLLHYVGYAYDLYGCPQWLLEALHAWRSGGGGSGSPRQLVTMFHEAYASGPPWTRAFWSSNRQKNIAAGLAQSSDLCRTNVKFIMRRIEKIAPVHVGRVTVAPVFSTVGEPLNIMPFNMRKRQMVVFGSVGWRRDAYFRYKESLLHFCRQLGIEQIIDVGKPLNKNVNLPIPIVYMGELSASKISGILSESLAGFVAYSERFLGKSTIYAAYCSHGMLPVGILAAHSIEDKFYFWHSSGQSSVEVIANNAHSWYCEHNLETQAEELTREFSNFSRIQ